MARDKRRKRGLMNTRRGTRRHMDIYFSWANTWHNPPTTVKKERVVILGSGESSFPRIYVGPIN